MYTETAAHLALLALFEGGNKFWSDEYLEHGALSMLERISEGAYADYKNSGYKLASALARIEVSALEDLVSTCGAFLITRNDEDWPKRLDELRAPPLALIGRGVRQTLENLERSISIVGTRNPTEYGVRVAGDFAAGAIDRGWSVVSGGAFGIDTAAHRGGTHRRGSDDCDSRRRGEFNISQWKRTSLSRNPGERIIALGSATQHTCDPR